MTPSSDRARTIALIAIGSLAIAAHLMGSMRGEDLDGPLLVLDHVFEVGVVGALLLVAFGLGDRVLPHPIVPDPSSMETLIGRIFVGAGILATALLILGLSGAFEPWIVGGAVIAAGVVGRRGIARCRRVGAGCVDELRQSGVAPKIVLLGMAALLLLLAAEPPTDWDTLMYHQQIPRQFLARGEIFVPVDNLHVAFVGLVHMLYVPLLAVGISSGPQLLNAAFAILLSLAVLAFGRRFFSPEAGTIGGVVLWASTVVVLVAVTGRVDVTLAAYLFVAQGFALAAGPGNGRALIVAALLAGFAAGIKYHALLYLAGLAPLFVWKTHRSSSGGRAFWVALGVTAGVATLTALPWYLKNLLLLGTPVFPFLADTNVAPWLVEASGGALRVPGGLEGYEALLEARRSFDPVRLFTDPGSLSIEGEARYYHYSPLLLVPIVGLPLVRDRRFAWWVVPAVVYVVVVPLIQSTTNLRYFVPALAPLSLGAGVAIRRFSDVVVSRVRASTVAWAIVLVSLIPTARWATTEAGLGASVRHAIGLRSERVFLLSDRDTASLVAVADSVDRRLGPDDRLLMLFEARGLPFRGDVLQDNVLSNWSLLSRTSAPDSCLESIGMTHVLINEGALNYYLGRGIDERAIALDSLESFVRRCLTPVLRVGGFALHRIDPPSPVTVSSVDQGRTSPTTRADRGGRRPDRS